MRLFVFLLIPFCCFILPVFSGVLDNVHTFFGEFSRFSGTGIDVINKMERFKEKIPELLKLLGPIGSMIALGAKITFSAASEEKKAVIELHNTVKKEFADLNARLAQINADVQYTAGMADYQNLVKNKLALLEEKFGAIENSVNKANTVQIFKNACQSDGHSPSAIFLQINSAVNEHCRLPTKRATKISTETRRLFRQIENITDTAELMDRRNFNDDNDGTARTAECDDDFNGGEVSIACGGQSWEEWQEEAIAYLMELPMYLAKYRIDQMRKVLADKDASKISIDDFKIALAVPPSFRAADGSAYFSCLLKNVAIKFKHKRQQLLDIVSIVANDVLKLSVFAPVCAGVLSDADSVHQAYLLDIQAEYIRGILGKMTNWLREELKTAWPEHIKANAMDEIGNAYVPSSEQGYAEIATRIQESSKLLGHPAYRYQIAVFTGWEPRWFKTSCASEETCTLLDASNNGVHVFLTRYDSSTEGIVKRAQDSNKWFLAEKENLKNQISKNAKELDVAQAMQLWKNVKTGGHYQNSLLLQNSKFWGSSCTIDVGVSSKTELHVAPAEPKRQPVAVPTGNNLTVHVDYAILNDECFILLFML